MKKNTGLGRIRNRAAAMSGIMIMSLTVPFASSMTGLAKEADKNTMGVINTKTVATTTDSTTSLIKGVIK